MLIKNFKIFVLVCCLGLSACYLNDGPPETALTGGESADETPDLDPEGSGGDLNPNADVVEEVEEGDESGEEEAGSDDEAPDSTEEEPPAPVCGNGTVEGDEACDDGNTGAGDGCSASCESETAECGNGNLESWAGEECDGGGDCDEDCHVKPKITNFSGSACAYSGSEVHLSWETENASSVSFFVESGIIPNGLASVTCPEGVCSGSVDFAVHQPGMYTFRMTADAMGGASAVTREWTIEAREREYQAAFQKVYQLSESQGTLNDVAITRTRLLMGTNKGLFRFYYNPRRMEVRDYSPRLLDAGDTPNILSINLGWRTNSDGYDIDVMHAVAEGGKIYESLDSGLNWEMLVQPRYEGNNIDFVEAFSAVARDDRLVVGTVQGIYEGVVGQGGISSSGLASQDVKKLVAHESGVFAMTDNNVYHDASEWGSGSVGGTPKYFGSDGAAVYTVTSQGTYEWADSQWELLDDTIDRSSGSVKAVGRMGYGSIGRFALVGGSVWGELANGEWVPTTMAANVGVPTTDGEPDDIKGFTTRWGRSFIWTEKAVFEWKARQKPWVCADAAVPLYFLNVMKVGRTKQ